MLADSRNDHIIPTKGVYLSWNIETGMFDFNNDLKFQKIWWEFSVYQNIKNRFNYEVGLSGGTGDKLVPPSEEFLTGGIRTIPGTFYEEYSALQYLRLKLKQNILFYQATFFETYFTTGYFLNGFWSEPEIEWNYKDFINSFYVGLTLNSSFGPIETGWGITAGNGLIKANSRLFLSIGYPLQ
ncbi:MAG: BamA/TamA family outer membrane protein [Candidatus Delongbacteria bacterium]|nr:BamA/TamA family outer membrane protein [Candidatus Delongbacteria bacterium]